MSITSEVAKNNENARIAQAAKDETLQHNINLALQQAMNAGKQQADLGLAKAGFQAGVEHGVKSMYERLLGNDGRELDMTPVGDVVGRPINMNTTMAFRKLHDTEDERYRKQDSQNAQGDAALAEMMYNANNGIKY